MAAQEQQYQQFRSSTGESLPSLEVQEDEYGASVIFWDEIEHNFKDVGSLRNGDSSVPFVRDKKTSFWLTPHRIKYYPTMILTVVKKESTSPLSSRSSSLPQSMAPLSSVKELEDVVDDLAVETATSPPPSSGRSKPKRSPGSGLVRAPSFAIIQSSQQALFAHQAVINAFKEELSMARAEDRQAILDRIYQSERNLDAKIGENIELTKLVANTSAELNEAQQQILKMQKEHKTILIEALERIKNLDRRVEALATMTLELFEFQVPRLFIVLPDKLDVWGDIWNPLTERFRLYFLCECGEHTKDRANSNRPNHIHMALHEGYPVTRPNEFFKHYGTYLLTVMEMVRYGTAIAGSVVPALGHLGITYGIEQIQNAMSFSKENITPLLDKSIEFTQSKLASSFGSSEGESSLEAREALQGADLRQLASFLKGADDSKALANLYRTVTGDGHVKWVCLEHFNVNYNERGSKKLIEVVDKYNGNADKAKGSIEVSLPDSGAASEFYGTLGWAKYFNTLFVTLEWEVSKADLESLYQGIMLSGITDLRVAGPGLQKAPLMDTINYKTRFDPLISLVTAPKLRSFALDDCPSFLKRVSSFRSTNNSVKFLRLTDTWSSQKTKASPNAIAKLVKSCPDLIELQLHHVRDEDVKRAYDALESTLQKHKTIKRVTFDGSVYEVVDGRVSLVDAVFPTDINKPLWHQQRLRRLTVESFSKEDLVELKKVVDNNPCLFDMTIRTAPEDLFKHTAQFQKLVQGLTWSIKATFGSEGFIGAIIVYNGTPPSVPEGSVPVLLGNGFNGTMDVQYWNFEGCGTTALQPSSDSDFEMLDLATRQLPAPFTALALNVSELSEVGLNSLGRVLSQTDLEVLSITTTPISSIIDKSDKPTTANALVSLNWSRLKRLELRGTFVHYWITEVDKVLRAWRQRGPSGSPPKESQWKTLSIQADGELTEVSYERSVHLISILKALPPKGLDLCNLKLREQDWDAVLNFLEFTVLIRLSLEQSTGYESIIVDIMDRCVWLGNAVFPADINSLVRNQQGLYRLTVESFSKEDLVELKKVVDNNPRLIYMTVDTTPEDLFKHTTQFHKLAQDFFRRIKVTFGSEGFIGATIVYNGTPPSVPEGSVPVLSGNGFNGTMDVQYWNFEGCGTTALQPSSDSDFEMLDWATRQSPTPFTTLALNVSELSEVGLNSLGRVLSQTDLEVLSITTTPIFSIIDKSDKPTTANALVSLNWSRLKRLELRGASIHHWITEVDKVLKAWRQRGPSSSPPKESQLETLLIQGDGEPTEVSYVRYKHLISILKALPPKGLDLRNLQLHRDDWKSVLSSVEYGVLTRLSLEDSVGYERSTVKEIVPSHVSCLMSPL